MYNNSLLRKVGLDIKCYEKNESVKHFNESEKEFFTRKKYSNSFLTDSRNSRFRAAVAVRRGGKRASEKTP